MNNPTTNPTPIELFQSCTDMTWYWARRYEHSIPEDLEDLVSVARIGLWQAALTYDPDDEAKFSTYAYNCIRHELAKLYRHYQYQKRAQTTLSLDRECWFTRRPGLYDTDYRDTTLADIIGYEVEYDLPVLLNEALQDKRLRMRAEGYELREIADEEGISTQGVQQWVAQRKRVLIESGVSV